MSWKREFGSGYAIPPFLDFLVRRGILYDISWHNDAAPSFAVYGRPKLRKDWTPRQKLPPRRAGVTPELEIRLWVDHPLKSLREGAEQQYGVYVGEPGTTPEESWAFDDLEAALLQMFEVLEENRARIGVGDPERFYELLDEHNGYVKDLFDSLVQEYYRGRPQ